MARRRVQLKGLSEPLSEAEIRHARMLLGRRSRIANGVWRNNLVFRLFDEVVRRRQEEKQAEEVSGG